MFYFAIAFIIALAIIMSAHYAFADNSTYIINNNYYIDDELTKQLIAQIEHTNFLLNEQIKQQHHHSLLLERQNNMTYVIGTLVKGIYKTQENIYETLQALIQLLATMAKMA